MEEGDREEPLLDDWHDGINAAEEESVEVPMIASRKRPRAKSSSEDESGGGGDGAFREDASRPKRLVRPSENLRELDSKKAKMSTKTSSATKAPWTLTSRCSK